MGRKILLITTDQQRFDALGCNGGRFAKTPNLDSLAAEGINATVVDMHTLKPLDGALIDRLVASCGAIVTAEDHSVIGGLGGAVAEHLTSNTYAPLERVGVQDRFGESGQADEMLEVMQISTPYIAEAAKRAIARKV